MRRVGRPTPDLGGEAAWGYSPPSQSWFDNTPFCEGLEEARNITQVVLTPILNLSLTHRGLDPPLIASQKQWPV